MKARYHKYNVEDSEFVTMTKKEYMTLIERFGEVDTSRAIEKLDNYKGAHGRRYKSDYRACLSWAIPVVIASNGSTITHPDQLKDIKDPTKLPEAWRQLRKQGWREKEVRVNTGTTKKWIKLQ